MSEYFKSEYEKELEAKLNIQVFDEFEDNINVSAVDIGMSAGGTIDCYTALAAYITSRGASPTDLYLSAGTYKLGTDITVPATFRLIFANGAMFSVDSGKTLTINGKIKAGTYQIFTGDGTIAGTPIIKKVYTEWFNVLSDNSTDNTAKMAAAVSFTPTDSVLRIQGGTLKANVIINKSYITIEHVIGGYIKPYSTASACFLVGGQAGQVRDINIKTLSLAGTNSAAAVDSHGLQISNVRDITFGNIVSESFGGHNLYITSSSNYTSYVSFLRLKCRYAKKSNIYVEQGGVYTTAVYINNVTLINDDNNANVRNITVADGTKLYINSGWIQGETDKCIEMLGTTSKLILNNVYVDSDNSADNLIVHTNTNNCLVYGSFTCDGRIVLQNGTYFNHAYEYLDGVPKETIIDATIVSTGYTDICTLGINTSYKITIAFSDATDNAAANAWIEYYCVCDSVNIKTTKVEIVNDGTSGINHKMKTDTNGSFVADADRLILQLQAKDATANQVVIKIEALSLKASGASCKVTSLV
jgi:hypothetical protein